MYHFLKNRFHISQETVHPDAVHPRHHRPLALLMVFCMLCQQLGMFDAFTASVSEATVRYVYIQNNPVIDDSWIGTPVNKNTKSSLAIKPNPQKSSSISAPPKNSNISQVDTLISDGSWILPLKKSQGATSTQKPNTETNNTLVSDGSWILSPKTPSYIDPILPSAPVIPTYSAPSQSLFSMPINYYTPSGLPYYMMSSSTSNSSTNILNSQGDANIGGSANIGANLSVSGSISSASLSTSSITITRGTGTPTSILGRDGSGEVNTVTLGSGLTLTGGRLTLDVSTSTLSTSGAVSGSTGNFGEIVSNTGTFSNIILSSASTIKNLLCDVTGNFFCDGGNTLGKDLTLGTNDAYDQIFETNNLERMRISSGGLVGIGMSNPTEKLSIAGNTRTTGYFQSNLGKFMGSEINDYIHINSPADDSMRFFLNDTERFTILSNGNIGIGNANPTDKLTLNYGYLAINDGGLKFDTEGSGLYTNTLDEEKLNFMKTLYTDGSAGYKWSWRNDDGSQRLDVLSFNKDGSAYFGGNLGVGMKPDPLARLSVSGKLSIRDGSQGTGKILTSDGNGLATWTSLTGGLLSGFTSGRLTFGTASGGLSQSNNLFWDNVNGRLGIGTMTPNSALNIVGDMEVTGKVMNHGFDFVLGDGDQFSRGNSGYSRALVKNTGNRLTVNFNGDFTGGTNIGAFYSQAYGTGNVGIGTQNPGEKLEVIGNMKVSGGYLFGNNSYVGGDSGGNIELGGNNLTAGVGTPYIDFHYSGSVDDFNTRIINSRSGGLDIIANTLYTNAKFGIGTSSPTDALQVVGASRVGSAESYIRTYFDGSNIRIDNTGTGNIVMNYLNGKSVDIRNLFTTYLSVSGDINQRDANGNGFIMHARGGNGYDFWQLAPSNSGTYDWSKGITLNRASGNVGIGNNTPSEKLSVFGNASFSNYTGGIIIYPGEFPSIAAKNGTNTVIGQMIFDTANKKTLIDFDGAGGGDFSIRKVLNSNADTVFKINSIGNVGIGTTTPSATLSVSGSFLLANGTQGAGKILTSDASGLATWTSLTGGLLSGFTAGQLTFGTASGKLTQSSNLFWDNTNGRLGIGTNTPQGSLDIIGGFNLRNTSGAAGSNYGVEFNTNSNAPRIDFVYNNAWVGQFGSDANDFWYRNSRIGTGGHKFFTNAGAGQIERLTIINNGNIGIGTSNPNAKLEVNSGIGGLSGLRLTQLLSSSTGSTNFSGILGVNSTGDVGIARLTGNSFTGFTAGQLTFGTASGGLTQSNNLFWDNTNGRLGIGINNPITQLANTSSAIQGSNSTNAFNGALAWSSPGTGFVGAFYSQTSGGNGLLVKGFGTGASNNLFEVTTGTQTGATTPIFNVFGNGNIGIGTTTPNAKLEINSGVAGSGGLRFTNLLSSSTPNSQFSGILGVNSAGDVGIARLTGNSFTGFTIGQLTFGTASGGLTSTGGLFWNSTTNRFSVNGLVNVNNAVNTTHPLTIRANGVDVLAFQDNTGTTKWHWNLLGSGLNFVESGVADYRLFLQNGGNVGIGTNAPGYKLHVNGTAAGTSWTNTSDERFKQNISNLASSLDIIKSLRSVSYNWNTLGKAHGGDIDKLQYGFIAQEVEGILPAIVNTDSEGYKSIDYIKIIPFLTKALQELAYNTASTGAVDTLSGQVASLSVDVTSLSGQVALLSQNSGSTVVNHNYYTSGATASPPSSSWIESVFSYASSLLVQVEATFSEMVTFMKSVVFRSSVTFEDRVTFSDKDMAGTAIIHNGSKTVRVDFAQSYQEVPKVIVTADIFSTYRVTEKSRHGFTIEVREIASEDIAFDWMAIVVRGAQMVSSNNTPAPTPPNTDSSTHVDPTAPVELTTNTGNIITPSDATNNASSDETQVAPIDAPATIITPNESAPSVDISVPDTTTLPEEPAPTEPVASESVSAPAP